MRRHTRRGSPCGCPPWTWTVAGRYRRLTRPNTRATMSPMYSLPPTPTARRPTPEERPEHCSNSVPILLKSSHPRSIRVPNPLRSAPECPEAHIRNGTKWNRMEHFLGVAPPGPAQTATQPPCLHASPLPSFPRKREPIPSVVRLPSETVQTPRDPKGESRGGFPYV